MNVSGRFVVKLPAERCLALIRDGGGRPLESGAGRVMREWVSFGPDRVTDWPALAREALEFNRARRRMQSG